MQNRFKKHKNKKNWKVLLAGILLLAISIIIDMQLRPVIQTMASYQAKQYAVQAINTAVLEETGRQGVSYENLVNLTLNDSGDVTSLQTDMVQMNRLQASVTQNIISQLALLQGKEIRLPIGTLIGGPVFSGRGPDVEVLLIPASNVETSMTNVFDSAGINQTRHQIMLSVKMSMSAIIPGYSVTTDVNTNICLAETIVVGLVPEAYTVVGDGTSPMVGMLEDFGARKGLNSTK